MTDQAKFYKLLTAPSPLPESSESDIQLSRYGERLLKQYIGAALKESLIPASTLLAHYLHIPPPPNETPFEVPVIVKAEAASRVLGSFMEFRNPSRHRHLSLTEKVTRTNQEGVIIVMSSSLMTDKADPDLCKHVHIHLKDLDNFSAPLVPDSVLEMVQADNIDDAGVWRLYSHENVDDIFQAHQRAKVEEPSRKVNYAGASDEDMTFIRSLFVSNDADYTDEYMFRVAPVIKIATVVFCVPKLYGEADLRDQELANEIGAGACVFYLDEDPDVATLENLYVISHKLCSVASNIYDIARIISEKKFRKDSTDVLGSIYHSLNGTTTKGISLNSPPATIGRILSLERVTVGAAAALISVPGENHPLKWANSGFGGESLGITIGAALSNYLFTLTIKDEGVRDCVVDPRLAVIIIELGRNLNEKAPRRPSSAEITIKRNPNNSRAVDVEVITSCALVQAQRLYQNIHNSANSPQRRPTKLRGTGLIFKLAHMLLDRSGGEVSWTFAYSNENIGEENKKHSLGHYCFVSGPASIFDPDSIHKTEKMEMRFRAQRLISIMDRGA